MEINKVVVAPDKFKGVLSASEVAESIKNELLQVSGNESLTVQVHPLADGGEGTVRSVTDVLDGTIRTSHVSDPLGRTIEAEWGIVDRENQSGSTAVIEMAAASGYDRLEEGEFNPLKVTTYGTGELILEAMKQGIDEIIVGLGGSATVDGGLGMARALGFRVVDGDGKEVTLPEELKRARSIEDEQVPESLAEVDVLVCCDVKNPLLGVNGAPAVYGPQKGADPGMVEELEDGLENWAELVESYAGESIRDREGSGAAGGLGFGLAGLLDGSLRLGAQFIMDLTNFNSTLQNAEVLITGEGKLDEQSLYGKTPVTVARRAKRAGLNVIIAVAGQLSKGYDELHEVFDCILPCVKRPGSLETHLDNARESLEETTREVGYLLKLLRSD